MPAAEYSGLHRVIHSQAVIGIIVGIDHKLSCALEKTLDPTRIKASRNKAAAIGAAIVIMLTGWTPIDPILSVLVALIILRSAWQVISESGHILLEGAPAGLDNREIAQDLCASVAGVKDVHHIHAWSITQERPMVTLHVLTAETPQPERIAAAVKARLMEKFGVSHATVEVEFGACADGDEMVLEKVVHG